MNPRRDDLGESFARHEQEQFLRLARTTTFEQRFRWLETMIEALRPQLLENYEKQKRLELIPGE